MRNKHSKHDEMVKTIADKLKEKGYMVALFVKYDNGRINGEFDILARHGSETHYFEIKSSYGKETEERALRQFRRAKQAYPDIDWRFHLVTNDGMREYRV